LQIPGYTGLDRIARGGFATVYRGVETTTGRTVAIKVLDRIGPREERRFSREFQTLGELTNHANVVQVLDLVRSDEGVPCLVLEYMGGGSLVDLMDSQPGGLEEGDVAFIADQVLAAVESAHAAGVLHRDIKPSNVLLGGGAIKLADFGIAKFTDSTATTSTAISTTVLFAAPEAIMNRGISERSDLYSLGATVYALLTGRPPHGSVAEALASAASASGVDTAMPGVSEGFATWVGELLAGDPENRPDSASDARAGLRDFLPERPGPELARTMALGPIDGRPAIDPPTTMQTTRLQPAVEAPPAKPDDRRNLFLTVGATAVIALLVAFIVFRPGGDGAGNGTTSPSVTPTTATPTTTNRTTTSPGTLVAMPDLSAVTDPEAVAAAAGLTLDVTEQHDDEVPVGGVISQTPPAGEEVEPGTVVTMVVSLGPDVVAVPDLTDDGDPKAALEEAGYVVSETSVYSDSVAEGGVIGTEPVAGTELASGSTVELIYSLGPPVVISIIDDSGSDAGFSSDIAIGSDGRGIIAYRSDGNLRAAHCSNLDCTAASISVVDDDDLDESGAVGSTAVAIGGDGLPLIVYGDDRTDSVWASHCEDVGCESASRVFLEVNAGDRVDAVTAPSGRVVFTYNDLTSGDVVVAACTNFDCTGATRVTLPIGFAPGISSLTYFGGIGGGEEYLRVLARGFDGELYVALCNFDCTALDVFSPDAGTPRGFSTSFATGTDGIGVFTYSGEAGDDLWVVHCADLTCTLGPDITRVDWDSSSYGARSAIAIGPDGLPVIAFYDGTNGDLVVAHCENAHCTEITVRAVDTVGNVGDTLSIAAAPEGPLLISYYDRTNEQLKVASCRNPDCS
jgi:tRNA A-37 threonylcarbamoyl transferase component Bud32